MANEIRHICAATAGKKGRFRLSPLSTDRVLSEYWPSTEKVIPPRILQPSPVGSKNLTCRVPKDLRGITHLRAQGVIVLRRSVTCHFQLHQCSRSRMR